MTEPKGCFYSEDLGQYLVDRARSWDLGEMVRAVSKTQIGFEWQDSLGNCWMMHPQSARNLLTGWNEYSSVHWFSTMVVDNVSKRGYILVSASMMQEVKEWLEALENC